MPNPDPYYAALEKELLDAINATGFGPQGFGGATTCLGVAIEQQPHPRSLPAGGRQHQLPRHPPRQLHTVRGRTACNMFYRHHCQKSDLAPLKAGDTVLLSGVVYTARDAAHARMMELLDKGEELPFPIEGAAVYYVGPTPERPGCAIGAAGPTTSGRMDAYTPRLLDLGLAMYDWQRQAQRGRQGQSVVKNGAVYLAAIGGRRCPDGKQRAELRNHLPGRTWAARPCVNW